MTVSPTAEVFSIHDRAEPEARIAMLGVVAVRALMVSIGLLMLLLSTSQSSTPLVWDEQAYLRVLEQGYPPYELTQDRPLIAFFPLFPLMARPFAMFMPSHVALTLVANVCSIIGFFFAYLWVRNISNPKIAMFTVLAMATSVSAIFFSRALTEGPFLMFVAITLWLMQKKRFLAAAVVCGLATMTRPTGVALAVTLWLYMLLQAMPTPFIKRLAWASAIGVVSVWGLLAYEIYLWQRYHRPDVYFTAQQRWQEIDDRRLTGESKAPELATRYSLQFFAERLATPQAWNRAFALAILGLTIVGLIRPGPIPRVVFVLPLLIFVMTALPNKGLRISSVLRYESAALPLFMLLGWWLSRIRRPAILIGLFAISLGLQIYYAVLFCRSVWIG